MRRTSIKPQKKKLLDEDLWAALRYVENDQKTDQTMYVSGINCPKQRAYQCMMTTKRLYGKLSGNVAYHGYQSFVSEEVTPAEAHKIGVETAKRMWGDNYEIIVTTHLNTDNIHNHFVVNSVSFKTGRKFENHIRDHIQLRQISDEVCMEHGKSVIPFTHFYGNKKAYWINKSGKLTHRDMLRRDVDEALSRCCSFKEFEYYLKTLGYRFERDFRYEHPSVIADGWQRAVRVSSLGKLYTREAMRKKLIDNQRKPELYAESHNYTVVGEYIDRAQSGKFDNRADFQRMIADSDKHTFEGVLVYQLDRFARNRYDSAIYKAKLKKNGVRVLSAKENITDDASGILIEGVLESMAEYYSVELAQKIHRGMSINAEKCLSNGSNPGLGFKVNKKDRTFYVDEEEAAIVREIYERYASGETKAEIVKDLQRRKVKTSLGNEFTYNSLSRLLKNKRYIGIYLYKGVETPGGMPRILDDDLFYRVQALMNKNKSAPARTRGENEYLLTTKLFCGHCKEMMVGYGGTGKSGKQYHYYMCKKARKKKCDKKIISKDYIEDRIVSECLKMLTDEKIRYIAKKVAEECNKSPDNISVREIKKAIKEVDTAIENLWKGIEQGQAVDMLTERLHQRQAEKAELETQLAIENNKKICLSEAQILAFLDYVCEMPLDDYNKRRAIINIFVHSIYLYDDHFTLIINASKKPLSIDNIPLDDIEAAFEGENSDMEGCSSLMTPAPPKKQSAIEDGALFF